MGIVGVRDNKVNIEGMRMAGVNDPRQFVLKYLFERCGFQFDESADLSPDTRQQIGNLARDVQGVWALDSQIATEKALGAKGTPAAKVPAGLGLLLVFGSLIGALSLDSFPSEAFLLGIALVVVGAVFSTRHKRRVLAAIAETQKTRNERFERWTSQAQALSVKVLEESRAAYQQRVKPRVFEVKVDFAEIIKAAQGKGVILDRVSCPSCGAAVNLPASGVSLTCAYCGNEVTATNVLEKMRSLLA